MTGFSRVFSRVPGLVAVIALLMSGINMPAFAQDNHIQRYGEKDKEESATEKAAKKEAERAYQRSLGNIPTQKSTDPWGTVRSEDAPKAATKTASPSPKPKAKNSTVTDTKTDSAAKQ
jgi:hypothetical protein